MKENVSSPVRSSYFSCVVMFELSQAQPKQMEMEPPPPRPPSSTKPTRAPTLTQPNSAHTIVCNALEGALDDVSEEVEPFVSRHAEVAPARRQRIVFGTWILGKKIGTGSSGSVKVVVHKDIGKTCVVKSIKRQIDQLNQPPVERNKDGIALREHFMIREALVGLTLDHPNIIKMHSYVIGKSHFYFFYEYLAGMDLADYVSENGRMDEISARNIFKQMLSAVEYIHKCNVIHRDLKLENIRIDPTTLHINILDFGFSTFYSPKFKQHSSCGSPCYASPEIYLHKPYRGPEVDVWSLGVCLYGITVGGLPFEQQSFDALTELVVNGMYHMPDDLSKELQILLSQMLGVDPIHRISISDILSSAWVTNTTNTIVRTPSVLPSTTPSRRIRAMYRRCTFDHKITNPSDARSSIGTFFARLRGATAQTAFGFPFAHSVAASTFSDFNTFNIRWVEDVLRMERHARAEFLLRELEKRSMPRKLVLERVWKAEGLSIPKVDPEALVEAAKKKVPRKPVAIAKRNVAEIWLGKVRTRRREVVAGSPTPIRGLERVFQKPRKVVSAGKVSTGATELPFERANFTSRQFLPLSLASRWNLQKAMDKNAATVESAKYNNKPEQIHQRIFRTWFLTLWKKHQTQWHLLFLVTEQAILHCFRILKKAILPSKVS
ncbi:kinase-like domain-containing protein [Chytriomyces sp. MP71]|nr:kinase-like domain-containing protein [Chytriomyces sp. MP71]